jgi:hypothetical protein
LGSRNKSGCVMLSLTKFNGIDPHGKPQTISWDQLAISPLQIVDIKENATSTGFYKLKAPEHYRKKENVISKHCLILDLDHTSLTFDEIADKLKCYEATVTTTWSHDPENGKNKYRVIINTDRDLTVEEYPKLLRGFLEKESFLKDQVDTVVKDAARLFFDYSIPSVRKHLARKEVLYGVPINVDEIINLQIDSVKQEITSKSSDRIREGINNDRTSPLETPYEIEKLKDALSYLSPDVGRGIGSFYAQDSGEPEANYWLGVILAIKSLNWKCGKDEARNWSQQSPRYTDYGFEAAWNIDIRSIKITIRSLYKKALEQGWSQKLYEVPPSESLQGEELQKVIDQNNNKKTDPKPSVTQKALDPIDEVNQKFGWDFNEMNLYSIDKGRYVLKDRFQTQHANQSILFNNKPTPLGTAWLANPLRRQISKVVMEPGLPESLPNNVVNSWKGFNYEPIKGDVKPFITLLKSLIPDAGECSFVEKWFAKLIQEPATKYNVALVLWSPIQGVGKNLLVETIGNLFNERHFSVVGQEVFADAFTDWQANKCLIVCDEVSSSDKRHIADRVKGWITSTKNNINCKHEPKFTQPNYIKYVFLSNHPDAVFFDNTDRRFFAVQTSSHQLSKEEVKDFIKWRNDAGYSALLEYLLNFDTSGFDPSAPAPSSTSKLNMVEANKSDLETWFDQYIQYLLDKNIYLVNAEKIAAEYFISRNTKCACKTIANLLGRHGYKKLTKQARDEKTKAKARVYALKNYEVYEGFVDTELAAEYCKQNGLGGIYI